MPKVLVVDDEAPIRLLCRVNLEAEGMEVVEATDGPAGLEKARSELPDVILLDVMMPSLDGFSVAERLLEDAATSSIPIVILTAQTGLRERASGLVGHGLDILMEPFNPRELAARVRDQLHEVDSVESRRRRLQQIQEHWAELRRSSQSRLTPRAHFERGPEAYVDALRSYLQDWGSSEDDAVQIRYLARVNVGESEDHASIVALGVAVGRFEQWGIRFGETRIGSFENLRRNLEREYAEAAVPPHHWPTLYGATVLSQQITAMASEGDETIGDRLDLAFQHLVLSRVIPAADPFSDQERCSIRYFFDLGLGLALFGWWQAGMEEHRIVERARWSDFEFLQGEEDPLANLDLPAELEGCILKRNDIVGYELVSQGAFGGGNVTHFRARGETADIHAIVKHGRLGARPQKVPFPKHVEALRALGFSEMVLPNDRRYRLSSWGGLGGVRRVGD